MTGTLDPTFGGWLRLRRQQLDLTRAALARLAGCAPITLQKLESGERRPSLQMAERLAGCLRIPERARASFVDGARRGVAPPFAAHDAAGPEPVPSSLPQPLTPLIGRDSEMAALGKLVAAPWTRLVTISGPAGVGKTHLALYLARSIAGAFPDGAVFVSLEHVRQPEQLVPAMARALELADTDRATLVSALHNRRMLLVLDNFEQIVHAAPLLAELLRACPSPVALITSREILYIRGEQPYALQPLALPEALELPALLEAPAVRLFATAAGMAAPAFRISAANAADVAAICRRLDGLPLAIELAASAIRSFGPSALLQQIEAALHLHTPGPRDLPDRQRTLRAALDWSYGLLDPAEQRCFAVLGVFVDGAEAEQIAVVVSGIAAVEQATGDVGAKSADAIAPLLASLVAKSLLQQPPAAATPRNRTLETMRLYALEQLTARGLLERAYALHAQAYEALARDARPFLDGPDQQVWLERLDRDYANLLAALEWYIGHDLAGAARLALALYRFWFVRGFLREAYAWFGRLMQQGDELEPQLWAKILNVGGNLAGMLGEAETGIAALEQSLTLCRTLGDSVGTGQALFNLGTLYTQQERYADAHASLEQSLTLDRARGSDWDVAVTLGALANLCVVQQRYVEAEPLMQESLQLLQSLHDDHSVALTLANMAEIAAGNSDHAAARRLSDAAVSLARERHYQRVLLYALSQAALIALNEGAVSAAAAAGVEAIPLLEQVSDAHATAALLFACARLAAQLGSWEATTVLLAAFEAFCGTHGITLSQSEQAERDTVYTAALERLEQPAYDAARLHGGSLPLAEVTQLAAAICASAVA